jgi:hypothetical protein
MASPFEQITRALGIGDLPWVIRAYLTLFIFCAGLLVFCVIHSNAEHLNPEFAKELPETKLFNLAADAEKTILGALIGSLSLAATREFGSQSGTGRGKQSKIPLQPAPALENGGEDDDHDH